MPDIDIGQQIHTVPMAFRFEQSSLDEYLSEFQGSALVRTVAMMRNDPIIAEIVNGYEAALLQGDWKIERAGDRADQREQAEKAEAVFFHRGERKWWTQTSWRQRLTEACESLLLGFAAWGRRWEEIDGLWVPVKFSYIHPSTIAAFRLSDVDESLEEIRRSSVSDKPLSLRTPRERRNASVFALAFTGVNYRGRSMARPMWRGHAMGALAHKIALSALQKRGSPMPVGKQSKRSAEDTSPKGKEYNARLDKIIKSMRGEDQAHAWARIDDEIELGFASPEGEPMDAQPIIERHAIEMLHAGGQAHKARGDTAVGAKGTAETQSRDSYVIAQSIAEQLAGWLVSGCGSMNGDLWEFWEANWGTRFKDPGRVIVTNIDPQEAVQNLPLMAELIAKGAMKYHPAYELEFCRRLDIAPRPGLEEEAEMLPDELAPEPEPPSSTGPRVDPNEPDKNAASLRDDVARLKNLPEGSGVSRPDGGRGAKPRDWFRIPSDFEEQFLNLGLIESKTTLFVDRYYAKVTRPLREAETDVVSRIDRGIITTRNYPTLRKHLDGPSVKYEARVKRAIFALRREAARFGALQVRDELAKQHAVHRQMMAVPTGSNVVALTSTELFTGAEMDAAWLIERLTSEIIREFEVLSGENLAQGEIAARMEIFLSKLSDKPIRDLARQSVSKAFNIGRNLEIQRQSDQIAFVVRTAIRDGHEPCAPCIGLDQKLYKVNSPAYFEFHPPNKCLGKGRCWCFYYAVANDGIEEAA